MNPSSDFEVTINSNAKKFFEVKSRREYYVQLVANALFNMADKEIFSQDRISTRLKTKLKKFRQRKDRESILKELEKVILSKADNLVSRMKFLDADFFNRLENDEMSSDDKIILDEAFTEVIRRFSQFL